MTSIRTAAAIFLAVATRSVAAQGIAPDSVLPGTPLHVHLATAPTMKPAAAASWRIADPTAGRGGGLFKGRFASWDSSGLHATDLKSGMSWTFPSTSVASVDALTGTDRSRGAIVRGALAGAVIGALAVYYEDAGKYHTYAPFGGAHDVNRWMVGISALGFLAGGAYRYVRPPDVWQQVRRPARGA